MRSSGPSSSSKTAPNTKPKEPEVINLVSDDEDEDEERMKELERLLWSSQERKAAYGLCTSHLRLSIVLTYDTGNWKPLCDFSSRRRCCLQTRKPRLMVLIMKMRAPIYRVVAQYTNSPNRKLPSLLATPPKDWNGLLSSCLVVGLGFTHFHIDNLIWPSVEDGTFPFYRTEDVGEER